MKKSISAIFLLPILSHLAGCQEAREANYHLSVKVIDDKGVPVENAKIHTSRMEVESSSPIEGRLKRNPITLTDNAGVAIIEYDSIHHESGAPAPGALIEKDGWYYSIAKGAGWTPSPTADGDRYEATLQTILKPIKAPIPMIFHPSTGFPLREIGQEYAFDLEVGELLPPHGNGKHPDVLAKLEGERIDNGPDNDEDVNFRVNIRFSNPLDGFVEFESRPLDGATGSALVSDHLAPEDGYVPQMERVATLGKFLIPEQNRAYIGDLQKKGYYFRVRTKVDDSGKIVSSNYGKIYGPIMLIAGKNRKVFHPTILEASLSLKEVYFNPSNNDRNVECDTKRNLLKKTDEYGDPLRIARP